MSKIKWAPIFPLIGGFPIAAELATGELPEYILSYDVAGGNDAYYNRYMNETRDLNIPFLRVDDETFDFSSIAKLDIGVATPFCSGLSMLNSSSNRGSDADVNKWIYESTEFLMKHAEAKVIIGENAPGMYSDMGIGMRTNLEAMADKYGYAVSYLKTSTFKHGIPQKRDRTFYFFWKGAEAPIFEYVNRPMPGYSEYMSKFKGELSESELDEKFKVISDNVLYEYFKVNGFSYTDMQQLHSKTLLNNFLNMDIFGTSKIERINNFITWLYEHGANDENLKLPKHKRTKYENALREAKHWYEKYSTGLGVWDSSLLIPHKNGYTNALISKSTFTLMHPDYERTLTKREKAHLMGLPADFIVDDMQDNVMNQNVPVPTAADMVSFAMEFLKGNTQMSGSKVLMQNNISQTIDYRKDNMNQTKLF